MTRVAHAPEFGEVGVVRGGAALIEVKSVNHVVRLGVENRRLGVQRIDHAAQGFVLVAEMNDFQLSVGHEVADFFNRTAAQSLLYRGDQDFFRSFVIAVAHFYNQLARNKFTADGGFSAERRAGSNSRQRERCY